MLSTAARSSSKVRVWMSTASSRLAIFQLPSWTISAALTLDAPMSIPRTSYLLQGGVTLLARA
jgi:hypothetical protein